MMDKDVEVEILNFTDCDPEMTHVIINVAVGKMPPSYENKHLRMVKDNMPLCKMLDKKGISYSIIGVRSDGTKAVDVEYKAEPDLNIEAPEFDLVTESFDCAMDIVK